MANNIFNRFFDKLRGNKFNSAFLQWYGTENTDYDPNGKTYLEKGYNHNSVVFSVINQQSTKTASIPYYIRKIEDKNSNNKLKRLKHATNNNLTIQQIVKKTILENKAYDDGEMEMPLERPNVNQSWSEFHALYKTFIALTGNAYIYMLTPSEGMNAGKPIAVYLLPSHLMKIVTRDDIGLLTVESPVKSYMLIEGKQFMPFEADNVIHIKLSNPNYSENGAHLYGQSRLEAALRNIQSSNKATDLNLKTLQNGGAFGFIHGKNISLTESQAKELKERLSEMNKSPEDLSKIAGFSAEVGFTRISLTTDELKPFEYLKYDQKQICNVLGWSDNLLNNDDGGKYDKQIQEQKRVVVDNIQPDLMLLEDALNSYFLPRFKGYENTEIVYDISELPEMQQDTKTTVEWVKTLLDVGVLNRKEARDVLEFGDTGIPNMEVYTVAADLLTLDEAIESEFNINPPQS